MSDELKADYTDPEVLRILGWTVTPPQYDNVTPISKDKK